MYIVFVFLFVGCKYIQHSGPTLWMTKSITRIQPRLAIVAFPRNKTSSDSVLNSYWRAGASQPSRTAGSDFLRFFYIYIYIYITGAAHTVIPIQRQHAHKIATSLLQCTRDRYRRKMSLASENAEEEETRLSRRRDRDRARRAAQSSQATKNCRGSETAEA